MNINNFISSFKGGFRPSRFRVQLTYPAAAGGVPNVRDEVLVKAASLPASNLGVIEVPYQGRDVKVAGDRTFDNWSVTVVAEESFSHRDTFIRWMNSINSHEGNDFRGNPEQLNFYMADLYVTPLSLDGLPLKSVVIKHAFPVNVGAIEMSYDQKDSIAEFSVEFALSYWTDISATL